MTKLVYGWLAAILMEGCGPKGGRVLGVLGGVKISLHHVVDSTVKLDRRVDHMDASR